MSLATITSHTCLGDRETSSIHNLPQAPVVAAIRRDARYPPTAFQFERVAAVLMFLEHF